MANWQGWIEMAQESLEAGGKIFTSSPRSSASRYYYAAYQAMTALLLYSGEVPPQGREAWNHENTPDMVRDNLSGLIDQRNRREDMRTRLSTLYKVRVSADYISTGDVQAKLNTVRKDATFLVKVATDIIVEGK